VSRTGPGRSQVKDGPRMAERTHGWGIRTQGVRMLIPSPETANLLKVKRGNHHGGTEGTEKTGIL
jgi:hypothetical protein